jgi:hypothetical protein
MTIVDRSNEKATHTLTGVALTAANFDAQIGLVGTYRTALEGIVLGEMFAQSINIRTEYNPTLPTSGFAQRELKLLVRYQSDVSGKIYTIEVPTPDLANLTYLGESDFIDLADAGIMATWVSAFEGYAKAPDVPTEAVTVLSAEVIGRNI